MKIKVFLLFASLFISSAGSQANPFADYKDMLKSDKYSDSYRLPDHIHPKNQVLS